MKHLESLSLKALNQYRRRDIIAYLGLRYYLENKATQTNRWAAEIATRNTIFQSSPVYLNIKHFKELNETGITIHRDIHLPGPTEALAEAALIDACARVGGALVPSESVFSYRPTSTNDNSGIFQDYIIGLQQRHETITQACNFMPEVKVAFFDIKRFYPSISIQIAHAAWSRHANALKTHGNFFTLGEKLLEKHAEKSGHGILTGPMFSHLIANLVLSELDNEMKKSDARYLRYVDDITLIGTTNAINQSLSIIKKFLDSISLELHDITSYKNVVISSAEWLAGAEDFSDTNNGKLWMSLVGDIKKLITAKPELTTDLSESLSENGFRLPIPRYITETKEVDRKKKFIQLIKNKWIRSKYEFVNIEKILTDAKKLRGKYTEEIASLTKSIAETPFQKKRATPKIRYRANRLLYLAKKSELPEISTWLKGDRSFTLQAKIMESLTSNDITALLNLGTNAAQSAAQLFNYSSNEIKVELAPDASNSTVSQSLAVFCMNGIIPSVDKQLIDSELLQFSIYGGTKKLMASTDLFIKEIASLHGISSARHKEIIESPISDEASIPLDAILQSPMSLAY